MVFFGIIEVESPLSNTVVQIVFLGSQKEMVGPNAGLIVTMMANKHSIGD